MGIPPTIESTKNNQAADLQAWERGVALRRGAQEHQAGWVAACVEAALEDPHPFPRSEAAAALAAAADDEVVPRFAAVLAGPAPQVQQWRAERLLIRRDPAAVLEVMAAEARQDDRRRRLRAVETLGRLGPTALPLLQELACHPEKAVRTRVAKALGTIAQLGCPTALARLAQDSEPSVQIAALRGLLRVAERAELVHETHGSAVVAVVCGRLSSGESEVRQLAIRVAVALAEALSTTDVSGDQLTSWLAENDDPAFRAAVVQLLGRRGAQKELHQLVAGSDPSLTQLAAWALNLDEAEPRELVQLLAQSDSCLRQAAVRAAAGHPDRAACRDILEQARNDSDEGVRWLAARGRSGRLDRRWAALQRGRLPSEAASAQWPFGLPAPDEDTPRRARLPVAIAAFNLSYNLNLGVLIRSAEAAGAREVLIVGKDFYHRLAAMGADKWVDVHFFATAEAMVAHARQRGYQLVAVQQSPTAERFDRADYPPRPCLVVGSEGPGLSPLLCAQADLVVEIPQRGEIDSLNVATAATLVLWACLSRRGWL